MGFMLGVAACGLSGYLGILFGIRWEIGRHEMASEEVAERIPKGGVRLRRIRIKR